MFDLIIKKIFKISRKGINSNMCAYLKKKSYQISEVFNQLEKYINEPTNRTIKVNFDDDYIKANSLRYKCFFNKGVKCVHCGIEGSYFTKERNENDKTYHLNLYAINDKGEEVLMTKDHIVPKSKGGKNHISNFQTMCCHCNHKKADAILNKY